MNRYLIEASLLKKAKEKDREREEKFYSCSMFTGFVSLFKFIQLCRSLRSEVLIADAIQSTDLHVGSVDGERKPILRIIESAFFTS